MGTTLNKAELELRIDEAVKLSLAKIPGSDVAIAGACVLYAHETAKVLQEEGYTALVQGGSAFWRMAPDSEPGMTWVGYGFNKDEAAHAVTRGYLPELHAWVVVMETEELVDCTAKHQATQLRNTFLSEGIRKEWREQYTLPSTIWKKWSDVGARERYAADDFATAIVNRMIKKYFL